MAGNSLLGLRRQRARTRVVARGLGHYGLTVIPPQETRELVLRDVATVLPGNSEIRNRLIAPQLTVGSQHHEYQAFPD